MEDAWGEKGFESIIQESQQFLVLAQLGSKENKDRNRHVAWLSVDESLPIPNGI